MAIKLGGGSAGAEINEYRWFVDQGNTFTGDNGFVWLKKGARSYDTTTYPDAHTFASASSKSTDYQAALASGTPSPMGLGVSSDAVWALNGKTTYNGTYVQTKITTDTVNDPNTYFPGLGSGDWILGTAYIKCLGSATSTITNANNYFAVAMKSYSGQAPMIYTANLVGGTGTDNGKPDGSQGNWTPKDSSGNNLLTTYSGYATPGQPACMHWDATNRKMYIMMAYTYSYCHLFVYTLNSSDFGYTGFSVSGTQDRATSVIDWQTTSGSDAYQFASMSGDSTHLYVSYYSGTTDANGNRPLKIRKIPLSGNLSWASGTDITGVVQAVSGGSYNAILTQSSTGTFTAESLEEGPRFMRTVSSVDKFIGHGNSTNALREFAINVPVIGEDANDFRLNQTQYQRIK